ncbi:hypothetical protein CERSUDRAFT_125816 [Gelatoporia subvermispora B]|uniref:Uncharacterized protein n=1 Tax=Ceriporiopsis subvermispora (strain B) TaxID=914234 RepID=M2R5D9_CERS8|nr:hypothetical protein CERSUDRAFT_125816 [Gelatoporia subvermispora B]
MDREEKSEGDGQRRVPSVCLWRVTGGVQTGAGPPLCTGEPQAGQRSRGFQRLLAVDAESDADANTTNNVDNVDNVARTSLVNGAQPSVVRFIPLALCRPPDSRERLPSHAESSPITTPISVPQLQLRFNQPPAFRRTPRHPSPFRRSQLHRMRPGFPNISLHAQRSPASDASTPVSKQRSVLPKTARCPKIPTSDHKINFSDLYLYLAQRCYKHSPPCRRNEDMAVSNALRCVVLVPALATPCDATGRMLLRKPIAAREAPTEDELNHDNMGAPGRRRIGSSVNWNVRA